WTRCAASRRAAREPPDEIAVLAAGGVGRGGRARAAGARRLRARAVLLHALARRDGDGVFRRRRAGVVRRAVFPPAADWQRARAARHGPCLARSPPPRARGYGARRGAA